MSRSSSSPAEPYPAFPMTERITRDDVAHVADLARLTLSDAELDAFTGQLADVPGPTSDRDEVLAAAPSVEEAQFRVPPVLGEEP